MATPKQSKPRTFVVTLAKKDLRIPQPENGRRMEFGKEYTVRDAPFWRRRVRDGDVKLIKGPDMPVGTPVIGSTVDTTEPDKKDTKGSKSSAGKSK